MGPPTSEGRPESKKGTDQLLPEGYQTATQQFRRATQTDYSKQDSGDTDRVPSPANDQEQMMLHSPGMGGGWGFVAEAEAEEDSEKKFNLEDAVMQEAKLQFILSVILISNLRHSEMSKTLVLTVTTGGR